MAYTTSGGFRLCGSMPVTVEYYYTHNFAIGSVVYVLKCARKGKMQPVALKKVYLNSAGEFTYVDTFNRVWLEDELRWFDDAKEIALAYLEEQQQLLQNSICES